MPETTITEALAELKLIDKKIEKKREFIFGYLLRQAIARDPLEKNGGSAPAVAAERQAISDLQENKIRIRRAIQAANTATAVTIGGVTRSIGDWLVWRRDIAPADRKLVGDIIARVRSVRDQIVKKGGSFATNQPDTVNSENDIVVNVDEMEIARKAEALEETLGTLDGVLSLKNATVTISY